MKPRSRLMAAVQVSTQAMLLCLANGCNGGDKEPETVASVQAASVQKTDLARMVSADAVIFPIAQSIVTPKINAPVNKFYVVRGQKVKRGQLLAVLENRDLSAAVLDNKGAFDQAQAAYETTVNATLPEDVQKAQLEVETAKQGLDAQQKLYESRQMLFNQGALPRKDFDQARVSLGQAQSQYDVAKKHLDALNATIKQQMLKSAAGQLTSASGKYRGAEAQQSYSEIRSPIDGVITERPLYPGEMASTSAPLLTVMDISSVIAKAHMAEADALLVRKGDDANIDVPGLGQFKGTVTLVSPALDPNSTTVEVWVLAKNAGQQLRPGSTAKISITTQVVHDALAVPASAVLNPGKGQAQVMVVAPLPKPKGDKDKTESDATNQAELRDVKTGIQTTDQVQILSGLNPGEQVLTQGAYGLPDKTKIKIQQPPAEEKGKGEGGAEREKEERGKADHGGRAED